MTALPPGPRAPAAVNSARLIARWRAGDRFALRPRMRSLTFEVIALRRRQDDLADRGDVLSLLLVARDEGGRPMTDRVGITLVPRHGVQVEVAGRA